MSLSDISGGLSGSSSHRFGSAHTGSSAYASNSAYDSSSSLYDRHLSTSSADRDHHLRYEPEDYSSSVYGSSSHRLQDHEKYRMEDRQRTHTIAIPVVHYPSTRYEQSRLQASALHSSGHSVPVVQFATPAPSTHYSDEYIRAREDRLHSPKLVTSVYPVSHSVYPAPYSSSSSSSSSSTRQHLGKLLQLLSLEYFTVILCLVRFQFSIGFQPQFWTPGFIFGTTGS